MKYLNQKRTPLGRELDFLAPLVLDDLKRFGRPHDGGYLLPQSLVLQTEAMLSMGINDDWSLEEEIISIKPDIQLDAYDHTISARKFRRALKNEFYDLLLLRSTPSRVMGRFKTYSGYKHFFQKNITHYPKRIFDRINYEYDTTIDECFQKIRGVNNIFVKMDIEGAEYRALPKLIPFADRIHLLAFEMHDTAPHRSRFTEIIHQLQAHFAIVHLHGNNDGGVAEDNLPETLEITMVNKNKLTLPLMYRKNLPLPDLDAPNGVELPDIPLIFQD